MEPRVRYDPEADAFTVRLSDGKRARTVVIDDAHLVDLDENGSVVVIEVLTPNDPQIERIAARFGIEDQAPAILDAIREPRSARAPISAPGLMIVFDEQLYRISHLSLVPGEQIPVMATASGVAQHIDLPDSILEPDPA